jgi:hypothetical protein
MWMIGLLLLMLATASCVGGETGSGGITPGGGPGLAIEMAVLGEVPCPAGVVATTCVQVRVTNRGTSGDGSCVLWATVPSPDGDVSIGGPQITVIDLASGAAVTEILAWTKQLPTAEDFFFQGECDPGLRS